MKEETPRRGEDQGRSREHRRRTRTKDWNESIEQFTKGIDIYPGIAKAYCNRGNAYLNIGDNERAMADYNEAVELNPELAETYNELSLAMQRQSQG